MNISRRPATEADFEFARAVHHTSYRAWVVEQFGPWDDDVQDKFFEESWERWPYDIIEVEGERCGYCAIERAEEAVHLGEFALDAARQGHGIGTRFLRSLALEIVDARKLFRLRAMKANTRAIAFYRRSGFREIGQTDTQIIFEWVGGA